MNHSNASDERRTDTPGAMISSFAGQAAGSETGGRRPTEVFCKALEVEDADARNRFLDAACAGDPDLRRVVGRLLAVHREAEAFFNDAQRAVRQFLNRSVADR